LKKCLKTWKVDEIYQHVFPQIRSAADQNGVFEERRPMTLRFGLKQNTIQKIRTVFSRYPQIEKAVLYGSRAKGDYKNGSDIDLTLVGGTDLTLKVLYKIMNEIDDLLLPYTIDLSIFRNINDTDVIDHIQRVGVTFYEKRRLIFR
jgi:predicted nucleotidyltransferase